MRLTATLFLILLSTVSSFAADPTGHWEGVIHAPGIDIRIEVDLAKNEKGELAGTFNNLSRDVRGFPLSGVAVSGDSVTFAIKAEGGGAFAGMLNGKSMSGVFSTRTQDGQQHELPFELTRTGDAKIEATPKSAGVSKQLEGKWTGTLEVEGKKRQIGLDIRNHADGTATGVLITGDGLEIAITRIVQKGSAVTLDVQRIGGRYEGTLSGTELTGTWTQGPFTAPLTFRVAENAVDRWASAVGGREKTGAIASTYREATIEVAGTQGTIRIWHTADGKYRKEESVAGISLVETFDGVTGTLRQGQAPARVMTAVETKRARSQAFANWNAIFLAFFPERHRGTVTIEGDRTIVIAPQAGIERRVTLDPATWLPATTTHNYAGRTITVKYIAYETVDGVRFEKELHRSTGDARYDAVVRFTKTVINPPVKAELFAP